MEAPARSGFDLQEQWPGLSANIRAMLARCGVPSSLSDDLVQETGLRLLEMNDRVDPNRSVRAFANTIALNLLRDHLRQQRRLSPAVDLSILRDSTDVEHEAILRQEWARVSAAMAQMSHERRSILLAEIGAATQPTGQSVTAIRMLRMRARKQLTAMLEEASQVKAGLVATLHRALEGAATRLVRTRDITARDQVAQIAGAVAVIAAAAVGAGSITETADPAATNELRSSLSSSMPASSTIVSGIAQLQSDSPSFDLRATSTSGSDATKVAKARLSLGSGAFVEVKEDHPLGTVVKVVNDPSEISREVTKVVNPLKRGLRL